MSVYTCFFVGLLGQLIKTGQLLLTLYLEETYFNTFANIADPDQTALVSAD